MERADEFREKLARTRAFLADRGLAGALFATHANFAWISGGGRNHVGVTAERGVGGIVVTSDSAYLLADNIEARRLLEEELPGLDLQLREFRWWSGSLQEEALKLVAGAELASDAPIPGAHGLSAIEQMELRNPLLPSEMERYRALGRDMAVVMTHVAFHCRPALSEHQLAGMLGKGLMDFGITPAVTLVAVDERVFTRRHPIPTDARLNKYALLVAGGRRAGLNLSISRLVHFGAVPGELRERHHACCRVDAAFLAGTKPGAPIAEAFAEGQTAYGDEGYPDEWQHHHQGGPTGYAGRDVRASPTAPGTVQLHQAFAWNPTIQGTKSEDTVLVTEGGIEVLSRTPDLPEVEVEAAGQRFVRADILER